MGIHKLELNYRYRQKNEIVMFTSWTSTGPLANDVGGFVNGRV